MNNPKRNGNPDFKTLNGEEMTWEEAKEYGYMKDETITLDEAIEADEGVDENGNAA